VKLDVPTEQFRGAVLPFDFGDRVDGGAAEKTVKLGEHAVASSSGLPGSKHVFRRREPRLLPRVSSEHADRGRAEVRGPRPARNQSARTGSAALHGKRAVAWIQGGFH